MPRFLWMAPLLSACTTDPDKGERDSVDLTWRPCRTWCEDLVDTYAGLSAGAADTTGAPGWEAGSWDPEDYLESCTGAPETDSCDLCTGWYFTEYLQPIDVAAACDLVYRPRESQAQGMDPEQLEVAAEQCAAACDEYGLDP